MSLDTAVGELEATALRVKAERDHAVKLLREVLTYETIGRDGPFKTKVREWFARIGEPL